MSLDDKVRNALIAAGFPENESGLGFMLYSSETMVVVLHIQFNISEYERREQLERYQQALAPQFDVELVFPALNVTKKEN